MNNRSLQQEALPILAELQKGYSELAQKMAVIEKSLRKLRDALAATPAAAPKQATRRRDDPDDHLGRRGVE